MTINEKTNYSNWTKDDFIEEIKKLRDVKKYGLIWDKEKTKEVFEKEAQGKFPILKDVTKNGITDGTKPNNVLIEGDNYHALSVLNYTHEGMIDVIYIDPPYNTGSRTWKYNNNFVNKDDAYRHSKWIEFMNKRLTWAKELLRDDGIICVTIDDYEFPRLAMLMENIFGENNHLGNVIIRNNPSGRTTNKKISVVHEYAIFYGKSQTSTIKMISPDIKDKAHTYKIDHDGMYYTERNLRHVASRASRSKKNSDATRFYPIFYDPITKKISTTKKLKIEILPIDINGNERVWSKSKEDAEILIKKGDLWYSKNNEGDQLYYKQKRDNLDEPAKSIWSDPKFSAREHGTNIIKDIFGTKDKFEFPKSLYAVMDCIKISTHKKNAIILDFFAGSGTTGQAVLQLNKEDGGNRKFILCTNNENNICTDICYPRLKRVIKGYKNINDEKIVGLGGNLKYFKTSFVDKQPTDKNKRILVDQATEMLCLKEDCFEFVKEGKQFKIFKNHSEHYLGIIYYYDGIEPFKKYILKLNKKINTYMFSFSVRASEGDFDDIRSLITLKTIPIPIMNVYKRIYGYDRSKRISGRTHHQSLPNGKQIP